MSVETFLYVIIESGAGPVKIGVSTNPRARLTELQSGNSRRLQIGNTWKLSSREAAFALERNLKHRLAEFALVGEWYRLDNRWAQAEIICEIEDRRAA